MPKNILGFAPHMDDDIIGMGGTFLNYWKEGKKIVEVIFSKGEKTHPHFKEEIIVNIRKKEIEKVAQKIGINKLLYFDLNDLNLKEEINQEIKSKIKEIIQKHRPEKIFTVSNSETHPDHIAVNNSVLEVVDSLKEKYPVYTFSIWTTPKLKSNPIFYVDISKNFFKKINLMKQHKSQWISIYLQLIPVVLRAKYYGIKNKCKYAEKFEKIRWRSFQ